MSADDPVDTATDEAFDTVDDATVLSRRELVDVIHRQLDRFNRKKQAAVFNGFSSRQLTRRDFLKLLGIAGGSLGLAVGAGIIPKEEHVQTLTGYAEAKDNTSQETKTVTVSGNESFSVGSGDTIQNMFIDITQGGADAHIRASGSNWEIYNIGFKGPASRNGNGSLRVSGKNGKVGNVYIGDGANSSGGLGAIGVYVNHGNTEGPIEFANVHIAKFPNNGIYGSPTAATHDGGIVHIYDSFFNSNNVSQFKIGSPNGVCNVVNTTMKTDESVDAGSHGHTNKRAAWVLDVKTGNGRNKGVFKDCDIQGRIGVYPNAIAEVQNCRWDGQWVTEHGAFNGGGNPAPSETIGSPGGTPDLSPPDGVPMSAEEAACME